MFLEKIIRGGEGRRERGRGEEEGRRKEREREGREPASDPLVHLSNVPHSGTQPG